MRLDNFLLREFKNVPKSRIYKIIRNGEVRVNKGRARPGMRLSPEDDVRLPPVRRPPKKAVGRPPDGLMARIGSAVVAETEDYLVFAKPAGLAVHAGSGLRFGLIEVLRAARPHEYFELVHRLDRNTSGCLLVARSRAALDGLRAGLSRPDTVKRYVALVEGRWQWGEIEVDVPLSRDVERAGERVTVVDREQGKSSLSFFRPRAFYADATRMEVEIRTGRTHQIRVHAAHCGHPVVADDKYGPNARLGLWKSRGLSRMALHAASITMNYQGGRQVFEAPLADDLMALFGHLE